MSAQHTPGPWHRNVPPATKYTTVWSGRNKHVARVVVDGLTPAEVEANIALIAAAPDLLAALAALHNNMRAQDVENDADRPTEDEYRQCMRNAAAAIAKATWSPHECGRLVAPPCNRVGLHRRRFDCHRALARRLWWRGRRRRLAHPDRSGTGSKACLTHPDCSVALYGDSILYGGVGPTTRVAGPPAAGVARLRPSYRVIDHSVIGDSAHARMPTFINEQLAARLVVLEYGMNDAGQGYSDYDAALRAMVQRVKALGRVAIVTGLSRTRNGAVPNRDAYDQVARRIAADEGALFADWGSVRFDPADMADDVHPAQAYSTRLTEQLVHALDQAAPECE